MREQVVETFIKARSNFAVWFYYIAIVIALIAIPVLLFQLAGVVMFFVLPFLLFVGIYGIVAIKKHNKLEFEFSIVRGECTISEIRNQTNRKKIIAFPLGDVQGFQKIELSQMKDVPKKNKDGNPILFCFGDDDEDIYHYNVRNSEDGKTYDVYMAYDYKVLEEMASFSFEVRKIVNK